MYIIQYQVYIPLLNGNELLYMDGIIVLYWMRIYCYRYWNILPSGLELFAIWNGIICHMEWNYLPYGMELFAIRNGIICYWYWFIEMDLKRYWFDYWDWPWEILIDLLGLTLRDIDWFIGIDRERYWLIYWDRQLLCVNCKSNFSSL